VPLTLLLINGWPATGKTTLAQWLAQQLRWPAFYKDDIKEILFDTLGWSTRERSRQLGVGTIEILYYAMAAQLNAGVSCIFESNFSSESASPRINDLLAKTNARCIQVLCHTEEATRRQRFQARVRHPGHADSEPVANPTPAQPGEALQTLAVPGPLIEVDTTDLARVSYEDILNRIQTNLTSTEH
jgi:predicted kinase